MHPNTSKLVAQLKKKPVKFNKLRRNFSAMRAPCAGPAAAKCRRAVAPLQAPCRGLYCCSSSYSTVASAAQLDKKGKYLLEIKNKTKQSLLILFPVYAGLLGTVGSSNYEAAFCMTLHY